MRRKKPAIVLQSRGFIPSDINPMRDTLLREGWRMVILLMIFALAMVGLSMVYRALFAAMGGAWPSAAGMIIASALAAFWLKWLCENRNELVES